jgi:hypothetical protein
MEKSERELQLDAVNQIKGVVSPLAGFSFAGLVLLINANRPGVVYLAAYVCICIATIALICAAVISSMLGSALNFDALHLKPLRWIFAFYWWLSLSGIGLFFVGIILLGFFRSLTVGIITTVSVVLLAGVTLAAFVTLNRRYTKPNIPL